MVFQLHPSVVIDYPFDHIRLHQFAPVGHGGIGAGNLQGRDRHFIADAHVSHRITRVIGGPAQNSAGLRRQVDPGLLARVFDGPIAAGPECRSLTGEAATLLREHDLDTTSRHVADAVAFSERIGVSGECVAFARDMLADALSGSVGTDESTLLKHFSALAEAEI